MKKSMIQIARDVLENNHEQMPFLDLWKAVSTEMGFTEAQFESNIAQFGRECLGFKNTPYIFRKCNGYGFHSGR